MHRQVPPQVLVTYGPRSRVCFRPFNAPQYRNCLRSPVRYWSRCWARPVPWPQEINTPGVGFVQLKKDCSSWAAILRYPSAAARHRSALPAAAGIWLSPPRQRTLRTSHQRTVADVSPLLRRPNRRGASMLPPITPSSHTCVHCAPPSVSRLPRLPPTLFPNRPNKALRLRLREQSQPIACSASASTSSFVTPASPTLRRFLFFCLSQTGFSNFFRPLRPGTRLCFARRCGFLFCHCLAIAASSPCRQSVPYSARRETSRRHRLNRSIRSIIGLRPSHASPFRPTDSSHFALSCRDLFIRVSPTSRPTRLPRPLLRPERDAKNVSRDLDRWLVDRCFAQLRAWSTTNAGHLIIFDRPTVLPSGSRS